jgi:hypothetical protein
MANQQIFRVGDWVEVRSKAEVLATLDKIGRFEGMPFMPQMLQYCGKRFRVLKSAHKACNTATLGAGAFSVNDVVHLENLRCTGADYDGCQSACLFYFKHAWLKRVSEGNPSLPSEPIEKPSAGAGCTEADIYAATKAQTETGEVRFVCQATQLPLAAKPLPMWALGQYVQDLRSRNTRISEMIEPILFGLINKVITAGIGFGTPLRTAYDLMQKLRGKTPYPWRPPKIARGAKTPTLKLDLQPGEWVRIKPYEEILATVDQNYKNRGMAFNAELAYYCGKVCQVLGRIDRIMDERNGKLLQLKNDCILLSGTDCVGRFTKPLFCPRGGYTYWREIWLERVPKPASLASEPSDRLASSNPISKSEPMPH